MIIAVMMKWGPNQWLKGDSKVRDIRHEWQNMQKKMSILTFQDFHGRAVAGEELASSSRGGRDRVSYRGAGPTKLQLSHVLASREAKSKMDY